MVLALFFTRGISLEAWVTQGLFDREKLIYEEHLIQHNLEKVYWFTYGSKDRELSEELKKDNRLHKNIEVFDMPKIFNIPKIGSYLYSLFLPFIYKTILKQCNILKTNQMDGSWSAVISKWLYSKPLIVRTGYTLSIFLKRQNASKVKQYFIELAERLSYKYADASVVASNQDKRYLTNKYNISADKINVLHNYIDTSLFKPKGLNKYEDRIVFVGRLNEQKNLFNLIEAISKTDFILDIYGKGELKKNLVDFANKIEANVNFKGVVANQELPIILNKYTYYILASFYEGMPKTLLEAMSCGCVCIGTDVSGINEVIKDGFNGYLFKDTKLDTLTEIINNYTMSNSKTIVKNGIMNINTSFSLQSIVKTEFTILNNMHE
jgi:glycosyltransferase involved in cell wall biosynthesis